jgi:hypothetical protein
MTRLGPPDMSKISLRRLLTKLTVLALSTTAATVAEARPERCSECEDDAELDPALAIDHSCMDTHDAALTLGRGLAQALGEMPPLDATHLAASWALSDDPIRRHAVASSLEWQFRLVGDDLVIDHLSRDDDPAIRAAAARAAWSRRTVGGDPGVLARLVDDPDPDVRAIAKSARV